MRILTILSVIPLYVFLNGTALAQQPPPNEPPQLWRAQASKTGNLVVVQIARPVFVSPRKLGGGAEAMKWQNLEKVTLGPKLRAFGVDGKQVEPQALLKALAKPRGVAVIVQWQRPLIDPHPFYLDMLRKGTILFVVHVDDIEGEKPIP